MPRIYKKVPIQCEHCLTPFLARKGTRFCSPECRRINKPAPKNKGTAIRVISQCEVCATSFETIPGRAKRPQAKYCSRKCYLIARWGETSHKETRQCVICEQEFVVYPSSNKTTCGKQCEWILRSRTYQGEKSNFWRGGKMTPYNGVWRERRQAARERDGYKCVLCGSTDRIQVHHIVPYRYSHSHELSNLVTLCRSCHSREEIKVNQARCDALFQPKT
jgi:5-methylcytosine-specific restriction endonuclease McrA